MDINTLISILTRAREEGTQGGATPVMVRSGDALSAADTAALKVIENEHVVVIYT
jgi:hypothetical protein